LEDKAIELPELSEKEKDRQHPRFGYREFDEISEKLGGAFERISAALNRERDFVRHASHELRTPITVIQSNVDLLRTRLPDDDESVGRIARAAHKMQSLVETLLWLGRETSVNLDTQSIDLADFTKTIADEHRYLLHGKPITVDYDLRQDTVDLPPEAAGIAISNLIRNAYQHTVSGRVLIRNGARSVTIENSQADGATPSTDGLGLTLVRKTVERMGWVFSAELADQGRRTKIQF
jgi:signal transduction histidine kinase